MKHVTLRQLRIFRAVVDEGSFSNAARALHLTQPAVSLQVKELERDCGLPLLERSGRRIRPTEAGRELMRSAHLIDQELKAADEAMSALKGLRGGQLTVAVISTAQYYAPRLLAEFCRRNAGVQLRLDVCNRDAIIGYLERDEVDLAIMGRPPEEIATQGDPFAPNPHIVIASPDHPLARRRHIPLAELLQEPFIAREVGSGTRALSEQLFAKQKIAFRPTLVMNSNEAIKQAVVAGMGVSLLSLHTASLELATRELVALDVTGTPIVRRWYLVHRREKRLSPAALAFRGFMLDEARDFVEKLMKQPLPRARRGKPA